MENQACDEPEIDTATTEPGRLSRTNSGDGEHFYALKRVFPRGSISGAWRLVLRRQGQQIGRTFKDSAYGSAEAAFEQARDYRDAVMQAWPPATLREKANCRRSDNTSGVSGVYKAHDPQPRWVAYISSQEGTRTRSYSVSKYGEEAAKHLAIAKRHTWLAEIPPDFHTVGDESKLVAHQRFPDRLSSVPDVTNGGVMPDDRIKEILAAIDQQFLAKRPIRLRVTVRSGAADRLHAIVAFNHSSTQIRQITIGTRSRSLDESLPLMASRLERMIIELCGEPVARKFKAECAGYLLDPASFDPVSGSSVTAYIPRTAALQRLESKGLASSDCGMGD
ncbi:AP2/ERF family transcription factor [Rhizobium sp. P44RR-XXIV]|uniref:AP2/ERF family transcription factor n=1 Tax=Rhizobium sp. P44RR-XXIV TaxID=1921145 RepID=UPI0010AAE1FE|nr:AP2/ERF family transcription factor [Rhizobium sp. P44RR-XXIV]TIX90842.1 AP2 domain-containing protein [Rhizobium sp. P44RR-XXIV]